MAVNEDAAYVALLEDLPEEDANQYDPVQQKILDDVAARVKIVVLKQYVKEQRESMLEEQIKESSKLAQLEAVKDELKAILEKLDSWGRAEFLWESDFNQFTEMWRWFRIQRGPKRIEINLAIKYADTWQVENIEDHINTGEAHGLGFSTVYSGYDKQIGRKIVSPDRDYVKGMSFHLCLNFISFSIEKCDVFFFVSCSFRFNLSFSRVILRDCFTIL